MSKRVNSKKAISEIDDIKHEFELLSSRMDANDEAFDHIYQQIEELRNSIQLANANALRNADAILNNVMEIKDVRYEALMNLHHERENEKKTTSPRGMTGPVDWIKNTSGWEKIMMTGWAIIFLAIGIGAAVATYVWVLSWLQ